MRNEVIVTRDIANNKNNTPPENMDAFMLHTSSSVFSFITERRYLKCNRFHISCLFFFFLTIHFFDHATTDGVPIHFVHKTHYRPSYKFKKKSDIPLPEATQD